MSETYDNKAVNGKELAEQTLVGVASEIKREGYVSAAAFNEVVARLVSLEKAVAEKNLGERVADSLDAQSLKVGGEDVTDASNHTATFTQSSRTNLTTGEKLSVMFGKIAKWFSDLKTVAFSGSYNDLSNKPTIPAAQVNSDWNANSGFAQILNKPDLTQYTPTSYSASVATKGYKIATIENSGGGDPMYAGCMIAVCLRDNGGADCQIILSVSFSEYSGSANVGPVSGKAFTLHNRLTTIGAIRFFVNRVSESKYDIYAYTNGTNNYLSCQCISGKGVTIHNSPSPETIDTSGSSMTELTRSRAVVAQDNGQIGSDTRSVYMDASGVLKPCQSGLSLNFEAVDHIPANPIVGKLYAL
jgi:hypothetical protein